MSHQVELAVEIDNCKVIGKFPKFSKNTITLVLKEQNQDFVLIHYNNYRCYKLSSRGYSVNPECGMHFGILQHAPILSDNEIKKITSKFDKTKLEIFMYKIEHDISYFSF